MTKRIIFFCINLFFTIQIIGQTPRILLQVKDTAACRIWVERQLNSMTLKQKIGQLFIHTVAPVTTQKNKNNIETAIKEYGIGGLLFSGGNLNKQIELTNFAQQTARIPLLITFDGEWGLGMRLKETFSFPRNRILGCIQNDSLLYEYGREVARQCKEIGVHVNFAPVADVDNNPDNPVINIRSFGSDPKQVARKVVAYAHGLEDGGVLAVCKHFPGHGDTNVDSHKSLPTLHFGRERLDSIELLPFRAAIEAGISGVMTGHLRVPALGKQPASISPEIIGQILKHDLCFSGLVFTDALEMKGISGNEAVCAQALIAGNDLLLAPRNLKRELSGVMHAIKSGKLTEAMITEKCRKVLTYKYALGLSAKQSIRPTHIEKRLYTSQTDDLVKRLNNAAVTIIKDSVEILPLDLSLSGTVLLSVSSSLAEDYPFYKGLRESVQLGWIRANLDSIESLQKRLRPAQRIIIALHSSNIKPYAKLLQQLVTDKPTILVCFNSQKILEKIPDIVAKASTVVLAHSNEDTLQNYVAEVLTGKKRADGHLSFPLNNTYMAGSGVTLDPEHPRNYCPEDFGMNPFILAHIDSIAEEGIKAGAYPGCHILILREGYPIYNKCFGTHTYESTDSVKENDLYDLASLSKTTATLLAVMKLYDEGKFGLTDKVSQYLPYLKKTNKANITLQDLLYHESGLPSYWPFYQEAIDLKTCKKGLFRKKPDVHHSLQIEENLYACTDFSYKKEWISTTPSPDYPLQIADSLYIKKEFKQTILKKIADLPLKSHSYRYSCLNFMLLKEVVEQISGMPMDVYLDSMFYKPMGLRYTTYFPLRRFKKEQIIPTIKKDFLRKGPLQGFVHDEAAAFMGGVSGNAGLFSTAQDVARIYQMLLNRGVYNDRRYLSRATCDLFLKVKSKNSRRGLGFDKPDTNNPENSPCTPEAPASVFGHTGFTGTCAWVDPDNELVFIFLSNRVYPYPFKQKKLMELNIRPRIQQTIYQSIMK